MKYSITTTQGISDDLNVVNFLVFTLWKVINGLTVGVYGHGVEDGKVIKIK